MSFYRLYFTVKKNWDFGRDITCENSIFSLIIFLKMKRSDFDAVVFLPSNTTYKSNDTPAISLSRA